MHACHQHVYRVYVKRPRSDKADGASIAKIKELEQCFGLQYNPDNLLFDNRCRSLIQPVDHYIRDWMHTLVSHGVFGTETAMLFAALRSSRITLRMLSDYASNFKLPKARGKVDLTWFADNRVEADRLRTFAGEQLNMAPIVLAFLEDVVAPRSVLEEHIECYSLMVTIVEICSSGPMTAARNTDRLSALIVQHHRIYARIYPSGIKPKWHHMLHLIEGFRSMGVCLSCFAMERKHRSVKAASLRIFRHFESTVLRDLAHSQLIDLSDPLLYKAVSLINPRAGVADTLYRSTTARFPCGELHIGDVCWAAGRSVVGLVAFFSDGGDDHIAQVEVYTLTDRAHVYRVPRKGSAVEWLVPSEIIAVLTWGDFEPGAIRVCTPRFL